MKKSTLWLALAGMVIGTLAYAGSSCCPSAKAALDGKPSKADCDVIVSDEYSSLELSDEQRSQIVELQKQCAETGCTMSAEKKMCSGLKEILTEEQYTRWESAQEKTSDS